MSSILCGLLLVTLGGNPALAASGSGRHLGQDECARRAAECEKRCTAEANMDRLSCKTDCRLAETQCRHGRK